MFGFPVRTLDVLDRGGGDRPQFRDVDDQVTGELSPGIFPFVVSLLTACLFVSILIHELGQARSRSGFMTGNVRCVPCITSASGDLHRPMRSSGAGFADRFRVVVRRIFRN